MTGAEKIFHQKITLRHSVEHRFALFEMVVWKIPKSKDFPEGIKYRAWLSENRITLLGFDNHKPKGPHLHFREFEVGYVFRGIDELMKDMKTLIEKEGFIYED